jgi:hypothetical protein
MGAPSLDTMLHLASGVQLPLSASAAVLVGLAALAVVTIQGLWLVVRHVSLIAHEGAHAVVGSSFGGQVRGMKLNRNGTGVTTLSGGSGTGSVVTALAGYFGPSILGLGAAKLISLGHIVAVLWLALVVLALTLPMLRTTFGFVSVIVTGFVIYLVARYATLGGQILLAYAIAWLLLLSGVRVVVERGRDAADAGYLASTTRVPRLVWAGLWLVGTVLAVGIGGGMLV